MADGIKWLTEHDVVTRCSSGAMLRGVLHIMDDNNVDAYKLAPLQLIEVPTDLELLGPSLPSKTESIVLETANELDAFERSIQNTEISLQAKTKFKGLCEAAKIGGGVKHKKGINAAKANQTERKLYSKVQYTIFPAASLVFDSSRLRLSRTASQKLDQIYQADTNSNGWKKDDKRRFLYRLCVEFFEKFGTHINCGIYHLGGIVTKTSKCEWSTKTSTETVEEVVSTALNAYAGVGYSGIGAELTVARMKEDGKIKRNFNKELETNTKVICQQYGGLPITDTFNEGHWKNNLLQDRTNWRVIDRGDTEKNHHIGVWDLPPMNQSDVKKNEKLHKILYGYSSAYFYRSDIDRIISVGKHQDVIPDALEAMKNSTGGRFYNQTLRVTEEWLQLLQDDGKVACFLLEAKKYLTNFKTEDLEMISSAVSELLYFAGGYDFPNKNEITQMNESISQMLRERKETEDKKRKSIVCVII